MGESDIAQCKLLGSSRENGNCAPASKPAKPPIGGFGRDYINPFVHEVKVTNSLTKLKICFLTIFLLPIRMFCIIVFLLIAWALACLGLFGVSMKELETKPLSKWRRALRRLAAISMRLLYVAGSFNFIKFKGKQATAKEAPIICVAPHSSIFDSLVVLVVGPPSIVAKAETASILFFGKLINFTQPIYVWREDPDSRQTTIKNIITRANSSDDWPQILIFPEGTCANRKALITFKPGAFYPGVPVQPVCVRYPNDIDSYTWTWEGPGVARLLWLTLTKWHSFLEVEYLPVYTPNEEEKKNPKLFAQNVRDVMAKSLNIPTSDYSYDDCVVMTKAKDMQIPYPADVIEIRRYRNRLDLDSTNYDINLLNTSNYCNINQWPDIAQFAEHLHVPVNSADLNSLFSLFTQPDDDKHISLTAYLLCALFLSRKDEESILDFLRIVSKLYQNVDGFLMKEDFQSILLHSGKLSKKDCQTLIKHFYKNETICIKFAYAHFGGDLHCVPTVFQKLENGNYLELRKDPLPESIKRVDRALKEARTVFKDINKLRMPNPSLPRMRCQPKIHKDSNEMREIIADSNSTTYNIAKWLIHQWTDLGDWNSKFAVKNSAELISKLQNIGEINDNETMVSFDVKTLFPNTPIKHAIYQLEVWLQKFSTTTEWRKKVKVYKNLALLCMSENYFTFREKFYKTTAGVAMGNPLSPLIAEIFMEYIESVIVERGIMPRVWLRYVDDIFAIVQKDQIYDILNAINKVHPTIEFTMEQENNGSLPFLDLLMINNGGPLEFEIYRKPTATQRTIMAKSAHPTTQKLAAYNSMVHRLVTYPLTPNGFNKEKSYIVDTAIKNGYNPNMIDRLITKKQYQVFKNEHTTFFTQNRLEAKQWISIPMNNCFYKIKSLLRHFDIHVVASTRSSTLKHRLRSEKDPLKLAEMSGIYKIGCSDCEECYIGQTKRLIRTRFQEHMNEIISGNKRGLNTVRSAVAMHAIENGHTIREDNLKLVKYVNRPYTLDAWESLFIIRHNSEHLLNTDQGNCPSKIIKFLAEKHRPNPI